MTSKHENTQPSASVENTTEFWGAEESPPKATSASLQSKEVEDWNSSCSTDLGDEMPTCVKMYLTPQIPQARHLKTGHSFPLFSSVFSTCMLYLVYSDMNCFSQKKPCGQRQSYLQRTRGGAEAEKEEET